jgi:PAS domain S-box-containing protein
VVERLTRAGGEHEKRRRDHILTLRRRADDAAYHLGALVESSDSALIAVTPDGLVTTWNRGAQRLFQWTADEARGRSLNLLIRPRNADTLNHLFERVVRGEVFREGSVPCVRRDGSRVDLAVSVTPIVDVVGTVKGAWITGRDLTTQQWAASRFRGLFEGGPDATVIVRDGRIELVNSEAERLLGYTAHDVVGRPIELLLPEWPEISRNGKPRTLQLHGRARDGTEFPVEATVSVVEAEEGDLVSAAIRDSSAQVARLLFADAFEAAPVAMALVSSAGNLVAANERMLGWLGVKEELLSSCHLSDVMHPDDWIGWQSAAARLLGGAEARFQLQQVWRTAGGENCVRVRASLARKFSHIVIVVDED